MKGKTGHDDQHVDAALTDCVQAERHRRVGERADEARAVRRPVLQEAPDAHRARRGRRRSARGAAGSPCVRARRCRRRRARRSPGMPGVPVPTPFADHEAKKCRHVDHHESSGASRPTSGRCIDEEVARANEPQHDDEHHDERRLGAKRRHDVATGRVRSSNGSLVGDLVELLVLGEGRGETDAGRRQVRDLFSSTSLAAGCRGPGRSPSRNQRHDEAPEANSLPRPADGAVRRRRAREMRAAGDGAGVRDGGV